MGSVSLHGLVSLVKTHLSHGIVQFGNFIFRHLVTMDGPGGKHSLCGTAADEFSFTLPHTYLLMQCVAFEPQRAAEGRKADRYYEIYKERVFWWYYAWWILPFVTCTDMQLHFLLLYSHQDSILISICQGGKTVALPPPHHLSSYKTRTPTTTLPTHKALPL